MQKGKSVVALCDDEPSFLGAFLPQVRSALTQLHEECDVWCYDSAEKLLNDIRSGKKPSILLLDVMMEGLDGMSLAREMRKDANDIPVIFVSSNRECALYGYELSALRYLAKPVDGERLLEALGAAIQIVKTKTLALQASDGLFRLDIRSIRYAEMQRRGVQFHLQNGTVLDTRMKISDVEQMLPADRFYRCHQGYIISMEAVSTLLKSDVVLDDDCHIPVSRYRMQELRQHFLTFLRET